MQPPWRTLALLALQVRVLLLGELPTRRVGRAQAHMPRGPRCLGRCLGHGDGRRRGGRGSGPGSGARQGAGAARAAGADGDKHHLTGQRRPRREAGRRHLCGSPGRHASCLFGRAQLLAPGARLVRQVGRCHVPSARRRSHADHHSHRPQRPARGLVGAARNGGACALVPVPQRARCLRQRPDRPRARRLVDGRPHQALGPEGRRPSSDGCADAHEAVWAGARGVRCMQGARPSSLRHQGGRGRAGRSGRQPRPGGANAG